MEKIKLVIWDLDDTFWKGTLSEGEIVINENHVQIIRNLTKRGIMNSICSKNDYDSAKKQLEQIGLWDYFIFPSITWNAKGESVKRIIDSCQLRAPNVLFIDDNITNRKEVEHYNPGIETKSEKFIQYLLEAPELEGKDDFGLSRLKQYKILEKKAIVKESYSDNHAFLIGSEIQLCFIHNLQKHKDRVLELINRTNQLNYTKVRLNENEIDMLLSDQHLDNVCIGVKDKFGDYGICGFYSLNRKTKELKHFLFSCRILNLGVENYVYQKIGLPKIEIVKPVANTLDPTMNIDWINEVEDITLDSEVSNNGRKSKLLLIGGCDLDQMCHYIDSSRFEIIKEFNYPNKKGIAVHREHTSLLRACRECSIDQKEEILKLSLYDDKMFNTIVFSNEYDILIYSVLMNYTQNIYERKGCKYRISSFGAYLSSEKAINKLPLNDEERKDFVSKFDFVGQQSPEDFLKDLEWLYDNIKKPIVFINGAEVEDFNPNEVGAYERHCKMNAVLDQFLLSHPKCKLIDVRKFVKERKDNKDNIRHYQRTVYIKMAEELMAILIGHYVKVPLLNKVKDMMRRLYSNYKRHLSKIVHPPKKSNN